MRERGSILVDTSSLEKDWRETEQVKVLDAGSRLLCRHPLLTHTPSPGAHIHARTLRLIRADVLGVGGCLRRDHFRGDTDTYALLYTPFGYVYAFKRRRIYWASETERILRLGGLYRRYRIYKVLNYYTAFHFRSSSLFCIRLHICTYCILSLNLCSSETITICMLNKHYKHLIQFVLEV